MKFLLILLLPFTFHAQSIDSLQLEIDQLREKIQNIEVTTYSMSLLKKEHETLRNIMKGYVYHIDSLYTITMNQQEEINLLSKELLKSIDNESQTLTTGRKRLSEISTKNIAVSEEMLVRKKLYVNNEGRVVLVKVISLHDAQDMKKVDLIVARVKRIIQYEPEEEASIQTTIYTVKIIP